MKKINDRRGTSRVAELDLLILGNKGGGRECGKQKGRRWEFGALAYSLRGARRGSGPTRACYLGIQAAIDWAYIVAGAKIANRRPGGAGA